MTIRCACGGATQVIDHSRTQRTDQVVRRRACTVCGLRVTTIEIPVDNVRRGRGYGALEALKTQIPRSPEPRHRVAPHRRRPE